MISGCGRQLRLAFAGPIGLDFGAVMMMGQAQQVDAAMLADVLPAIEAAVLNGLREDGDDGSEG